MKHKKIKQNLYNNGIYYLIIKKTPQQQTICNLYKIIIIKTARKLNKHKITTTYK